MGSALDFAQGQGNLAPKSEFSEAVMEKKSCLILPFYSALWMYMYAYL